MIARTLNSTYEVDTRLRRIRRIYGNKPITVGRDGEWIEYVNINQLEIGSPMIVLSAARLSDDVVVMRSSPVILIEHDELVGMQLSHN